MIKELKMYTIICDGCGKDVCDGSEYSGWNEELYLEDIASEASWIKENDKHYCTDCFKYDDEDNLIIKNETKDS